MNRSGDTGGPPNKRKRPSDSVESLSDADRVVYNVIKEKEDMGIWGRDLKRIAKLPDNTVNKSVKLLRDKRLIKEVPNIQFKGRMHFMAVEFEPSKDVSGGMWYAEGVLDQGLISTLKTVCLKAICSQKVATVEGLCNFLNKHKVMKSEISKQQVSEILNHLVLDNQVMEVKSSGLGDYYSIPVGAICYRASSADTMAKGPKKGAMAAIPCGMCQRILHCTPGGIISPSTCEYYKEWLDF